MKEILKTAWFLFVTCAIAAVLLAATEQLTAPRIKEFQRRSLMEAKKIVLPGAETFKQVDFANEKLTGTPATKSIDLGFDAAGKPLGFVVLANPKGYGGPIEMVVGFRSDLVLAGVKIQVMKETPGLGTKLTGKFMEDFLGACAKVGNAIRLRVKKDGGDVDAITAATVSSRAFCRGIQEAKDLVAAHREQLETMVATGTSPLTPANEGIGGSK
ncbi:MAG: RnfABCDGE type electron transport complex subunit G [Candidatus Ozemobacteraceae bacterium]